MNHLLTGDEQLDAVIGKSGAVALARAGRSLWESILHLRTDLDENAAALLFLSAANWAYTWLTPERDTDALAAWYREHGGAVLSTTIDRYCYISVRKLPPFFEPS